jgi:hypothetical protein
MLMLRALLSYAMMIFVAPAIAGEAPSGASAIQSIGVQGTLIKIGLADGRMLNSPDLIGAKLVIEQGGRLMRIRIDGIERDPDDRRSARDNETIWLHDLSFEEPDGTWAPLCDAGPDGRRQAIPVSGRFQAADGSFSPGKTGDFELACTGGAMGKCIRFGYHPWYHPWQDHPWQDVQADAASTRPSPLALYNACIRMVRADYGGGGAGTTRDGMRIYLYDDYGINAAGGDESGMSFEAGWTPDGAACVNHPRVVENITLGEIEARWPQLANKPARSAPRSWPDRLERFCSTVRP